KRQHYCLPIFLIIFQNKSSPQTARDCLARPNLLRGAVAIKTVLVIAHFLLIKSICPTKVTVHRNRELNHAYDPSHKVAFCRHCLAQWLRDNLLASLAFTH
ncbi:hypothetical protein MX747_18685, partial [Klebsiella pneumoniae]|nr:hypothetical protein [Klebsiella pneumoniae]